MAQLYSDNIGIPVYCGERERLDVNPVSVYFQRRKMQQRKENMFFNQELEADYYIRSENERLRLFLHEQRKKQIGFMMNKIESKASILLSQKDEEIAKATNKTMELENTLKTLEMENQAWQRVAQENQFTVASLNNELEKLRERVSCCFNNGEEDAESCCNVFKTEEEERIVCKCCNSRIACVLFLPCRHLCSCKYCEALLDSCPVCKTEKKKSIEALIFGGEEERQNKKRKSDNHDYGE